MDYLQGIITDKYDSLRVAASPRPITLEIVYDDPELYALISVVSSEWDRENLMDSLKQGRLTNDLWALGLSTPDEVTSVCTIDDRCCCIRAIVMCDELTDLSLLSANKYTQQLKIKSITVKEKPESSDQGSPPTLPVTSIYDYYRFSHLQEGPPSFTPLASIPPFTPVSTWEQNQKDPNPVAALLRTIDIPCKRSEGPGQGKNTFATELKLALQTQRLEIAQRELQQCQARVESLELQLKDHSEHQKSAAEPVSDEAQIEKDEGEISAASVGQPMVGNENHSSIATAVAASPSQTVEGDEDDTSERLSCVRCTLRSQSLKLSELHVRTMELRVSMFERRQTETESHSVRLLHALLSERRLRREMEAELRAEGDKRQAAEAMTEAIANEAKWPFVTSHMLDVFLKLQGMVEEVHCE